jgi:hypothetical protein
MMKLTLPIAFAILMAATYQTQAHRITTGEIHRSGTHWCNWSVTSVCSRWRARGGKSITPCPPGNNWSSCLANRRGLR